MPGEDYLTPEFTAQAEALLRGIYAMAGQYAATQLNSGRDIVGRASSAKYHQYRDETGKAEPEPGIEQPVVDLGSASPALSAAAARSRMRICIQTSGNKHTAVKM